MDRDEALKLLKGGSAGIEEWNRRWEAGEEIPRLTWADLTGAHLAGAHLTGAHLRRADLTGAHLAGAHLAGAHLAGADLTGADLAGADLAGADLTGAHLTGAHLTGAHLHGATIDDRTSLDAKWRLVWEIVNEPAAGRDLRGADLAGAHLAGADLAGADLRGADLAGADLAGADLAGADLARAHLRGADLTGADLTGAHLTGADLHGATIDDRTSLDAKWRLVWEIVNEPAAGRDLRGADLTGADLAGAHLAGADLTGAHLAGADLAGADLTGADLAGAHLRRADLRRADLRGADLTGADLTGADLRGAHLPPPSPMADGDGPTPETAPTPPTPPQVEISQMVMTAYYPKEVEPLVWHPLHAYIFRESAASQVEADARERLGEQIDEYRRRSETARRPIAKGSMITATPRLEGFQFNPPSQTVELHEDWHRLDFRLRARPELAGMASNGLLTFTVEGVIVADIPISIYIGDRVMKAEMVNAPIRPYQSIFCSYSRQDTCVVKRVERACKTLGMEYFRDAVSLKSGEPWQPALLSMIERADIFQLFWSRNAAKSKYVEDEWRYALQLSREPSRFIRPVYWTEPMPSPPPELGHLSFAFVPELVSWLWRFVSHTYRLVGVLTTFVGKPPIRASPPSIHGQNT